MMYHKKIGLFTLLIIFFHFCSIVSANQSTHRIEILVNDKIITNYDIAQHFAINSILDNINVTAENGDFLYNKTVNELIDMKIQQAKIKEYDIKIEDDNKEYYENYYFQSKRLDKNKVYEIIKSNNLDVDALKEKINTSIAWEQLTAGLFFHTISISDSEKLGPR